MAFVKVANVGDVTSGKGTVIERDGLALAEGWLEAGTVVCPWHGFNFDLATGACLVEPGLAVTVYPVRVNGPAIEVDVP